MTENSNRVRAYSSDEEIEAYRDLERILRATPIFPGEILSNLGLFITRASMARLLFMHDLYLKILTVPGCVIELGCHWGQNAAFFTTFRSIYEAQNLGRQIIAFDTFEGLKGSSAEDGELVAASVASGGAAVTQGYELVLDKILDCHNRLGARSHIKKHEVIKGDVTQTLPAYLERNPETLIALIYFDLGVYEPTRRCLELIKDRLTKGSVIGLDHLAMRDVPGDSIAVREILGYRNHRFFRDPRVPFQSYMVIE